MSTPAAAPESDARAETRILLPRARSESHIPFRLAAIDIDGTLLGPDGTISDENAHAVRRLREAGIICVLASGRSHANMLPFHTALKLTGPLVSSQGAVVRKADGTLVRERCLAPEAVRVVTAEGRREGFDILQYRSGGVTIERRSPLTDYDQSRNAERQVLVRDLDAESPTDVQKIIWLGDPAKIARVARRASARFFGLAVPTHTDPEYLEFVALGVDKAVGVAAVAADLGLTARDVAAFGDGNNDVPLLAWAGTSVAMAHANDAAKAAARLVAPDATPDVSLARAIALACR